MTTSEFTKNFNVQKVHHTYKQDVFFCFIYSVGHTASISIRFFTLQCQINVTPWGEKLSKIKMKVIKLTREKSKRRPYAAYFDAYCTN
jgi:hypothetical protein